MRASSSRLRGYGLEVETRADEWRDAAMCAPGRGGDPEWWHSDDARDKATATRWCQVCPVRVQCLVATMAEEEGNVRSMRFGIWAGLSGLQRHRLSLGKPVGEP